MSEVKNLGNDTYEVRHFVQSMLHLTYRVQFVGDEARVIDRHGWSDTSYDRLAIGAVQSHIFMIQMFMSQNP